MERGLTPVHRIFGRWGCPFVCSGVDRGGTSCLSLNRIHLSPEDWTVGTGTFRHTDNSDPPTLLVCVDAENQHLRGPCRVRRSWSLSAHYTSTHTRPPLTPPLVSNHVIFVLEHVGKVNGPDCTRRTPRAHLLFPTEQTELRTAVESSPSNDPGREGLSRLSTGPSESRSGTVVQKTRHS